MPYNTLFPGQEPNEKVIYLLRRHWIILAKIITFYVFWLIIPLILKGYIAELAKDMVTDLAIFPVLKLIISLYYIYVVTFFYHAWLDYYLDVWIVTNKRVVNIEQKGLFHRVIASHRLYRIQDVKAHVKGIWPTFFHYGNVDIQTAGAEGHFEFKQVPNPYAITRKVIALVDWRKRLMMAKGIKTA